MSQKPPHRIEKPEKIPQISPDSHVNFLFEKRMAVGRQALELENFGPYKEVVLKYIEEEVDRATKQLIWNGLSLTNEQKNTIISRILTLYNISDLTGGLKQTASMAATELKRRQEIVNRAAIREEEFRKRAEARNKGLEEKRKEFKLSLDGEKATDKGAPA